MSCGFDCVMKTVRLLSLLSVFLILFLIKDLITTVSGQVCGQNRGELGDWFVRHGGAELVLDPFPPHTGLLLNDPYQDTSTPPPEFNPGGVCAMQWSDKIDPLTGNYRYYLRNFPSEESALEADFHITHSGHCGACSYLQDLGVYLRQKDLTDPVRNCALKGIFSVHGMRKCLMDIGFSLPCALTWQWTSLKTKDECFGVCIWSLLMREPNNKKDGSLNSCLKCDETKSVPIWKFYSGRTRRNSGILSAIKRPNSQMYHLDHCYWYGDLSQ